MTTGGTKKHHKKSKYSLCLQNRKETAGLQENLEEICVYYEFVCIFSFITAGQGWCLLDHVCISLENGDKADGDSEEAILRKAKPKSRSSKPVGRTGQCTSKYFQDQEEPVTPSHDNGIPSFFMEGRETLMAVENEEEEESEDDEWEDVEGKTAH